MEFSERTTYVVTMLAVSITDTVERFIDNNFEERYHYILIIDDELNVSCIYEDEAIELNKYDHNMLLDSFIEVEYDDDSMLIGVDMEQCDALAESYAPLIEYCVINSSKWHNDVIR